MAGSAKCRASNSPHSLTVRGGDPSQVRSSGVGATALSPQHSHPRRHCTAATMQPPRSPRGSHRTRFTSPFLQLANRSLVSMARPLGPQPSDAELRQM